MSDQEVVHVLLRTLKELPAHRWTCSVDTVRKGRVTEHKVGLRDATVAWARWKFMADGHEHVLEIEGSTRALKVTLDGAELAGPHLDFHGTTHGLTLVTVVRCSYAKPDGSKGEFRFDGTNASLPG
jgi:hypothetical protein